MTNESTTVVLGIPIPSTHPLFLAIVGVHVMFGLAAVTAGAIAMLSNKGRGRHSNWGTTYFWFLFGVFVTMSALSFMRWLENYHLFILGALSFASALFGRTAVQRRWHQWPRLHLTGMGASYILMLTAFYVDNGENLPLWRELPQIAFWFLPSAVGVPLILYALLRHPLVLELGRSAPPSVSAGAVRKRSVFGH
jgi:cell division protein FtsW (lipid II flippase)